MKVNFNDVIEQLDSIQNDKSQKKESEDRLANIVGSNDAVQRAVVETTKILIKFLSEHTSQVEVNNHPSPIEEVRTPDVQKVVFAVASLEKTVKENHVTDKNTVAAIQNLSSLIEKLPKQIVIPETKIPDQVTVKNQVDYSSELKNLADSIKKIDVRPEVTVNAPKVDVKTDSSAVISSIEALRKAVEDKPVPINMPTDLTPLIGSMQAVQDAINNQQFPVPNYVLPFKDQNGAATQAELDNSGNVNVVVNNQHANDVFNQTIIGTRNNQIEVDYSGTDPDSISILTVTKTNGGDASTSGGQAVFETSTNTSGEIKAITTRTITYHPHAESYAAFTAIFTAGIANSFQRIGLYDDNNGFFIGYEGTSFGVTKRSGASDTFVAKSSFNVDTLTGATGSKYTRNGTPEAIDLTKDNLFRIRFGWLGAAPIYYETLSPDGEWVTFHIIKHPNSASVPTVQEPNQPLRVHIKKTTAGTTNLSIKTACWAAGSSSDLAKITSTLYDESLAKLTRSVITGQTTAGGGGYVNVKVNPSGALTTDATISGTVTAESPVYYKRLDDTTTTNMIYIGETEPGTATSAADWRIKRLNVTTGLVIQWAGSGDFDQVWDNRAGLTYT